MCRLGQGQLSGVVWIRHLNLCIANEKEKSALSCTFLSGYGSSLLYAQLLIQPIHWPCLSTGWIVILHTFFFYVLILFYCLFLCSHQTEQWALCCTNVHWTSQRLYKFCISIPPKNNHSIFKHQCNYWCIYWPALVLCEGVLRIVAWCRTFLAVSYNGFEIKLK